MSVWVIAIGALLSHILAGCGKRIPLPDVTADRTITTAPTLPATDGDLILVGFERGQICRLIVHRQWYENEKNSRENYRLEVSTSYVHGDSSVGRRVLAFSPTEENVLLWEDKAKGEFLRLTVHDSERPLRDPDAFTVRWLHGKHHHKNTCSDLR